MDQPQPKYIKLEEDLVFLVEQLNQDINYLRESDIETQKKYELKIEAVIRRICLEPSFGASDISFLHDEFQERLLKYEAHLKEEFTFDELQDLSKELKEQIQPDEFGL